MPFRPWPRSAAAAALLSFHAACSPAPSSWPAIPHTDAGDGADLVEAAYAGLAWRFLPGAPGVRGKQDDLYFVSPLQGWSVNGEGNIYRTTDGGERWERVLHQPGTYFRAVVFADSVHGFAGNIGTGYFPGVTDTIPLYRTRDGGRTWTPVTEIDGPYPRGVCNFTIAEDGSTIWAVGRVGGPSFVVVSHDRGESWTSREVTDELAMLIDARFTDSRQGIIVGGSDRDIRRSHSLVLTTDDGGRSWREIFRSRYPMEMAWKIDFPTAQMGYIAVLAYDSTSTFLKTEDGGRVWQEHTLIDGPYQAKGVGFLSEDTGWMAGERPGIPAYRTMDGGLSWEPDPALGPLINRFRFVVGEDGSVAGYAIGMTIQKLDLPGGRAPRVHPPEPSPAAAASPR
jgi:photosystem II stability/assembly factor-like uncharacterized protein